MTKKPNTIITALVLACVVGSASAGEVVRYFYDAAGRLTGVGYTSGGTNAAITYAYDANGNRTNRTSYGQGDATDSDGDGAKDVDEAAFFGSLVEDGAGDSDGDGLINRDEFALGGDPTLSDTDGDGQSDGDEAIAGTAITDGGDVFEVANLETAPTGGARIWWNVVAGRTYQLQTRPKLVGAQWTDGGAPFESDASGPHYADEAYGTNAYYRVEVWITP